MNDLVMESDSLDESPVINVIPVPPMALESIVESLIFASERPLNVRQFAKIVGVEPDAVKQALAALSKKYETGGVLLCEIGGGYSFRTNPDNSEWVRRLVVSKPARLTRPMLETLAIVAYRQPITRPEIEEIRGVDCGGTMKVLLERNLVRIVGKKEEPGRPMLYGTTSYFLEFFNLKSLKELPPLKEFTELTQEHAEQLEMSYGETPSTEGGTVAESDQTPVSLRELFPDDDSSPSENKADASIKMRFVAKPTPITFNPEEDEEILASLERAEVQADEVLHRGPDGTGTSSPETNASSPPLDEESLDEAI